MATNTAVGAEKKDTRTVTFKNREHRDFYMDYMPKCRYQDVYHKALVYCLGIDRDTRVNADRIYDFRTGCYRGTVERVPLIYGGRFILLRLCKILLEGSQAPLS